ncbi:hypothetical protein BLOT_004459 [Blomia tropicalis]|nr:hypothetical protein BLOT_004459 [Blomia tropicalis]
MRHAAAPQPNRSWGGRRSLNSIEASPSEPCWTLIVTAAYGRLWSANIVKYETLVGTNRIDNLSKEYITCTHIHAL